MARGDSKTYGQLAAQSAPNGAKVEAYRATVFDQQSFVDNSTTTLSFFQSVQSDPTMGNLPAQAQFAQGEYFEIIELHCDFLIPPSVLAGHTVVGAYDDAVRTLYTNRPIVQFTMKNKTYGPWPLIQARPLGSPWGFGYGTLTAEASFQFANAGPWNTGIVIDKDITIPQLQSFLWKITWPNVVDIQANVGIRLSMRGIWHRPVA